MLIGASLSDELWYYIAEDMENAWLFDESEDWMAPFFDLEWAMENWGPSQWELMQSEFDDTTFENDADWINFMQTYGYYGNAEDSLWSLAESLIDDDGIIRAGLNAIGVLDEGAFEEIGFGDVGNMFDNAMDSLFGAGTTNAFTLAMALVSILIQFKN